MPKKSLVFVLKGYPRVSETFIAQEIYLLEQKGYDIEIFSMRQPRETQRQPVNEKIQARVTYAPEYIRKQPLTILSKNLKIFFARPKTYLRTFVCALIKSWQKRAKSPMKRFLQAAWLVGERRLWQAEEKHIHSHFIHAPTEMTQYLAELTGWNYSISAHAKDIYTISPDEVINRVDQSKFLTTCTRFNYDFLQSLPLESKSKVKLGYHGIDTSFFSPSGIHCLQEKNPYGFVSVGRLVEKKGYNVILEALADVKAIGISFVYDIYGAGDLEDDVRQWVTDRGLEQQVNFHLTATHPQIIRRLEKKGIFLCGSQITSEGDRDGIPNTVAEAMSMELPVIATKVSGIPELIEDDVSGVLIPSRDPKAMSDAIMQLIQDPDRAERLAKQGRVRVDEFFNCNGCILEIEKLLVSCL